MLLWGQPLMKLFVLIVSPSVSFLFEITISLDFRPIDSLPYIRSLSGYRRYSQLVKSYYKCIDLESPCLVLVSA
jgi:hypothetical protein